MSKASGDENETTVTNADAGPNEVGYMPQLHQDDEEVSVSDLEPVDEFDLEPEPDENEEPETSSTNPFLS